jgi:hypothetical protein
MNMNIKVNYLSAQIVAHYQKLLHGTKLWHTTHNLSSALKCGILHENFRRHAIVAHYPNLSSTRKCDILPEICRRHVSVAHYLKLFDGTQM